MLVHVFSNVCLRPPTFIKLHQGYVHFVRWRSSAGRALSDATTSGQTLGMPSTTAIIYDSVPGKPELSSALSAFLAPVRSTLVGSSCPSRSRSSTMCSLLSHLSPGDAHHSSECAVSLTKGGCCHGQLRRLEALYLFRYR